jgi:hypothetical protein
VAQDAERAAIGAGEEDQKALMVTQHEPAFRDDIAQGGHASIEDMNGLTHRWVRIVRPVDRKCEHVRNDRVTDEADAAEFCAQKSEAGLAAPNSVDHDLDLLLVDMD